jgi:hypothetical protein
VRVDGGAVAEGFVPAGLEGGLEVVAHAVGSVGVEAAHAGDLNWRHFTKTRAVSACVLVDSSLALD